MDTTHSSATILVTGASGKTGRRVVDRLTAAGTRVRAVGRRTRPPFSWDDPATWDDVLAPGDDGRPLAAAYLCFAPDAGFPGADAVLGAFAAAAARAGVGRLVLLTGRGEEGALRSERAVQAAGLPTVVVRSAFFAQGFTEDLLAASVGAGELRLLAGAVAEPFVDLDDLADVAVAGLRGEIPDGVHELTGPAALTMAEVAAVLSRAAGHPVTYRAVSGPEFRADLLAAGLPEPAADGLTGLFAELFDGRNVATTDGVRAALGRDPVSFAAAMERAHGTARSDQRSARVS
ncbi:hypothetical protein [Pseudonocardia sp. HH130630-07]|uniref:hypothetical protein n=1 Tax=Pseudonocardia sp. HH130630-07 TaxID=1690815 RepID=UPI000814F5CF|nr:hypothetical protein [Pseudonocardia sp. HH130630-07]ANY06177.1 hypothetical protein AFB00_07550 [Pseudonocardia sp. HH130630-07]